MTPRFLPEHLRMGLFPLEKEMAVGGSAPGGRADQFEIF